MAMNGPKARIKRALSPESSELDQIRAQLAQLDHRWQDLNHKLSVVIDNRIDAMAFRVRDALDEQLVAVRRELAERMAEVTLLEARVAELERHAQG